SSRRRHTRLQGDWSSDVCSSDLGGSGDVPAPASAAPTVTITATNQAAVTRSMVNGGQAFGRSQPFSVAGGAAAQSIGSAAVALRSEERRVGKGCRTRWEEEKDRK